MSEVHHLIEAVAAGGYDPGLVTSLAYVGFGALLFRSVLADFRRLRHDAPAIPAGDALARA